jgi:hypothetical protein
MESFLELLKYTIPGLVVFAATYFSIKQFLDDRLRRETLRQRSENSKTTLPLKLQAYERLILLCDRLSITNLLIRLRVGGMSVADLRGSLLIAVQQEFDHNVSQQLYVSDTLWQILIHARQQTLNLITESANGLDPNAPDEDYVNALLEGADRVGDLPPLQQAVMAIRMEAGQFFAK